MKRSSNNKGLKGYLEGGAIEEKKKAPATYSKGFNPDTLKHYLAPGEKPYTHDQLLAMGYTPGKSDNEYLTPGTNGAYVFYETLPAGSANYNVKDNPYYVATSANSNSAPAPATTDTTTPEKKPFKPIYPRRTDMSAGSTGPGIKPFPGESPEVTEYRKQFYASKRNGGGIKGYITGGNIQDDAGITGKSRSYGNSFGDYAHDVGLGILDWGAQGFGGQDLIKAEDYNTKAGVKNNTVNSGVGTVASGIGGAILDYYVPGLGTAARTGKKGVGKLAGEDEGISDKDKATMAKVDAIGDTAGGLMSSVGGKGGISGMFGKKKKDDGTTEDPAVAPVVNNTPQGTAAAPKQPVTQITDGNNLTGQALTDWKSALTGEAQAAVLAKYNRGEYGMAIGGLVKKMATGGGVKLTPEQQRLKDEMEAYRQERIQNMLADNSSLSTPSSIPDIQSPVIKNIINWQNLDVPDNVKYGEKGKAFFDNLTQMYSDYNQKIKTDGYENGGKIVGAGTGTSDSIKAKPEEGSFIVPAENAKKAEALREKYLGKPGKQIATLNKGGGVDVMLSNGEHMFTKAEADLLRAKGVDLDALAPNADSSAAGKKKGGGVEDETDKLIRELEEKRKKAEVDGQAKAELKKIDDQIQSLRESNASAWSKNKADRADKRNSLRQNLLEVEKETIKLDNAFKNYQKVKANKNAAPAEIAAAIQAITGPGKSNVDVEASYLEQAKKYRSQVKDILKEKMQWDDDKNFDTVTGENKLKPVASSNPKKLASPSEMQAQIDAKRKEIGTQNKPATVAPVNGRGIAGVVKSSSSKAKTKAPYGYDPEGNPLTKESVRKQEPLPMLQASVSNPSAPAPDQLPVPANGTGSTTPVPAAKTAPEKKGLLNGFDLEKGAALAQAGLGLQQLLKDGKRPVDSIDGDFAKTVEDAKTEAAYGISPLEREVANRGIDRNRASDVQTIISLSGGNAGVALGNIRAASIAANDSKDNLSVMSEKLRLEKKRYADSLVGKKADMSKQLFNEKLDAFKENQEAGAMLLGSGIRNFIGSQRYDKELAAQAERENKYNPTFNIQ